MKLFLNVPKIHREGKKTGMRNRRNTPKTNNKIVVTAPNISIITLSINGLNPLFFFCFVLV